MLISGKEGRGDVPLLLRWGGLVINELECLRLSLVGAMR